MENQDQIRNKLATLVQDVIQNDLVINDSDHLQNDLGIDSITFISLIVEIEMAFDVEIPDEMLIQDKFDTFESLLSTITELSSKETNEEK